MKTEWIKRKKWIALFGVWLVAVFPALPAAAAEVPLPQATYRVVVSAEVVPIPLPEGKIVKGLQVEAILVKDQFGDTSPVPYPVMPEHFTITFQLFDNKEMKQEIVTGEQIVQEKPGSYAVARCVFKSVVPQHSVLVVKAFSTPLRVPLMPCTIDPVTGEKHCPPRVLTPIASADVWVPVELSLPRVEAVEVGR